MLTCTQRPRLRGLHRCWLGAGLAAAALSLPACGDDGGGGGGGGPDAYAGDGLAPTVKVRFPPPSSLTDQPTITIRGSAADADDIVAIRVNGATAQSSDGFATWQATVALTHGDNAITIESEDQYGARDQTAAELTVQLSANVIDAPTAVVADPANGRALVFDRLLDALVAVSYATGERTIVSDDATGTGPELQDPTAAVLDEANTRVLALDGGTLLAVDLASGDRTAIASAEVGAGDPLLAPFDLALDAANDRVIVLDTDATDPQNPVATIFAVALATGDRTVIASGSSGSGPELFAPTAMAIDAANARVLVAATDRTNIDNPVGAILAVDLASGDRTVVATNDNVDQGDAMGSIASMVLDDSVTPARLLALDVDRDAVLAVALDTGNRTVVSEDNVSTGQQFSVPDALALDAPDGGTARALVIDSGLDMVIAVGLDDGARTVISGFNIGAGPLFEQPVAVALDTRTGAAGSALIVDQQQGAIVSVDLATSGRKELSGDDTGSGDAFDTPQALTLDVDTGLAGQIASVGEIVVVDFGLGALVSVNPTTGARTLISGGPAGSGPDFGTPRGVIFDPGDATAGAASQYLVVDDRLDALFAVDPASGARTIVSDASTGTGPALGAPQAVTLELGASGRTGRALVVTADPAALIAVDLATGDREELSGLTKGDGSPLEAPISVLMELRKVAIPDPGNDAGAPPQLFEPTGAALVVHGGAGALLAIDLATGRRTELFGADLGTGPALDLPRAVWLDAENDRLLIADEGLDALIVADRASLDRVVVSR
jgi:hypothetical protein